MKARNFTAVGALHPILFFAGMYIVVLFFSIFICSSLFYSCNTSPAKVADKKVEKLQNPAIYPTQVNTAVVLR